MASEFLIPGNAVHIANIEENKLNIDTDTFNKIIDKVGNFPMSIISVNGPMRCGKSYILTYFLKYISASVNDDWFTHKLDKYFHWKNSAERQTTGILMWSEPFFMIRNGETIAILLMDTQGCFDDKTTGQEISAIFALSCLLSSVLIFNIKNIIMEDTYQNLQMFIGYSRLPKDSEQRESEDAEQEESEDAEQGESEDSESFSKLVFLIRDWENPMDFEYGYHDDITSPGKTNFKKEKLDVTPGMAPENAIVRKAILNSFENVGCYLMPHPGHRLASYGEEENLEPGFIKTIKDLIPRMFDDSNICIKKIDGKKINGHEFKLIVKKWAKCFKKYDFPEVSNVTEANSKFQNHKAQSIAMKVYRDKMSNEVQNNVGLSEEAIEEIHKKNKEEAIAVFNRIKRIKNDGIKIQYMKKLEEQMIEAFETYQKVNRIIRIAKESGKNSEEEIKQLKEKTAKEMKQLERSQEASTNIMNKQHGYFTVRIFNQTDDEITLYWQNHHFWKSEKFVIESKVTKICSFYSYDNLLWSTKYKANIVYGNKSTEFWAFGDGAPREENTFTVKSDGIFLNDQKHSSWKDRRYCTVEIINETDRNIKFHWINKGSGENEPGEYYLIDSKETQSCSFWAYDHLFWNTKCKAIIRCGKKSAVFWAFGRDAPKDENIFKVKSDGIFLNNRMYKKWKRFLL